MAELKLLKKKRKAEAESNQGLLISVCIDLGELYFREGRYNDAIGEYKEVSAIYKEQKRSMDYARANRMIGEAYTHLRQFDTALKHQEVHLAVAKEQGDKVEEQRALATIGHTYLTTYLDRVDNPSKKTLELAYRAFKRSLAICESGLKGISKREHMDMTSRLLANLGVVEECLGNYEKGITLVQRSINICKANDIYEQLERGYTFLGSLYTKKGDYSNAIHFYNLAIEVAGRLDDKVSLMCAALTSKADILIKLADFHRAKNVLLRAYKLKNPNNTEHENVGQNLKVVTAMCYTEDSLLLASDTDCNTKKSLYEKMGDGACVLKNYSKAIEYYLKMLECAQENGDSEKDLSACYISLAQTYNDNEEFDLAIKYFEKDYEIFKGNAKESISTLLGMIESMEYAKKSLDDIIQVFNKALKECRDAENKYLEAKTLTRYISTLKKHNSLFDTRSLENELRNLDYIPLESDSETDEPTTQNIGDDIDLDAITDDSEASDDETNQRKPRTARRRKTFAVRRNHKGETQLHTACIAGNAALVEKLLDQGHVVNIRDHCGWLPLHEACSWGHLSIVKILVEKGAAINDGGGSLCLGTTPLHDSAANGHLEIVDYLLDKGASAVAKTDNGETVLDFLNTWREGEQLDPITQTHYENIVKRLATALEKTGQNNKENINTTPKENKALIVEETSCDSQISTSQKRSNRLAKSKTQIGDLRRNIENDNFDEVDEDFDTNATCEYKNIMENLRHRSSGSDEVKKRSSSGNVKRSALIETIDLGDDWLEDDLGNTDNKRRKTICDSYINSSGIRSEEIPDDHPNRKKRKTQSTLIKAGFTKKRSESPIGMQSSSTAIVSQKHQTKLTSFTSVIEPDSTSDISVSSSSLPTSSGIMNKTLSIDVRIDGKLFRIPIPVSEMDSLTMKWLADEATRRFYKKESMRPTIELETKNGALLSEDDFVSILFPVGGLQSEEVQAKVVQWNIPPLAERYKDACSTLNYEVNDRVLELLETTSITLSLPDENLSKHLYPVCKAINRQSNLHELNLEGNFIGDRCIELLCESFPTLDNLSILNLSSNNLTYKSLNTMSTALIQSSKPILTNLSKLDLSFNPLKNESFKFLAALTRSLKLKSLSLCSVDFTAEIFQLFYNKNLELQLEFIEDLDVSYNALSKDNLSRFISWLQPLNIKSLNLGNNGVQSDGLGNYIVAFLRRNEFGFPNLKTLNFSKCRINDEDVVEIISILKFAEHLEELDLSCNAITSSSLKLVLESLSSSRLNFSCCGITADLDWSQLQFVNVNKKCRTLCTTLDYVDNYRECDALINLWKLEYKEKADIKGLDSGMLHLSVSEFVA